MRVLITPRQETILQETVRAHIETGDPVGSERLVGRRHLGLSSATVRAEFASLEHVGLLTQPHPSSGRVPTTAGYRYYVNQCLEESRRRFTTEATGQFAGFDARGGVSEAEQVRRLTHVLAETARTLAVVVDPPAAIHEAGFGNLFESPEFRDDPRGSEVDGLLDVVEERSLELSAVAGDGPVVFINGENPFIETERLSMIFTAPTLPSGSPLIAALIGPVRMPYDHLLRLLVGFHQSIGQRR